VTEYRIVGSGLRIAIVSKSDSSGGGASRVAEDLVNGLNSAGHLATHFVACSSKGYLPTRRRLYGPKGLRKLTALAHRSLGRLGFPEALPLELPALIASRLTSKYDVVHFHDLSSAISPLTLRWLSTRIPVLWTFHDCSPFTGGCLYPIGCKRFLERCGTDGGCPKLHNWPLECLFDFTGAMQDIKASLHRTGRVSCLAPSAWMADFAMSSGKIPVRPVVVSNGVDVMTFRPAADRAALRRALGLPVGRPVILVSAGMVLDERKGARQAIAALRSVDDLNPFTLVVGGHEPNLSSVMVGLEYRATGYVSEAHKLALWYSAADLHLFCSQADNQPLTVLETMSCGTPTVGFSIGGIPEMVVDGVSGMLVPQGDASGLVNAIRKALQPGVAAALGREARICAESRHSMALCLDRHVEIYEAAMRHFK